MSLEEEMRKAGVKRRYSTSSGSFRKNVAACLAAVAVLITSYSGCISLSHCSDNNRERSAAYASCIRTYQHLARKKGRSMTQDEMYDCYSQISD